MKKYFTEYGHLTLAAIVVALLVAIASPVGNLIKASTTDLIDADGIDTRVATTIFNISPTYGLVKTYYVDDSKLEEGHIHDFTNYNSLDFIKNGDKAISVYIRHSCSCHSYQLEYAPYTCVDNQDGTYTYTATSVIYPGLEVTKTIQNNFTVTLNGNVVGAYDWGDECALTAEDGNPKKWFVTGDESAVLADGTATYRFQAVKDMNISYIDSEYDTEQATIYTIFESTEPGKAEFFALWNIPSGSTITSIKICRGHSGTVDKTLSPELLIEKGTVHNLTETMGNVLKGNYRLKLSGVNSGYYLHAVMQIIYTDVNNETHYLVSPVMKVQVQ